MVALFVTIEVISHYAIVVVFTQKILIELSSKQTWPRTTNFLFDAKCLKKVSNHNTFLCFVHSIFVLSHFDAQHETVIKKTSPQS